MLAADASGAAATSANGGNATDETAAPSASLNAVPTPPACARASVSLNAWEAPRSLPKVQTRPCWLPAKNSAPWARHAAAAAKVASRPRPPVQTAVNLPQNPASAGAGSGPEITSTDTSGFSSRTRSRQAAALCGSCVAQRTFSREQSSSRRCGGRRSVHSARGGERPPHRAHGFANVVLGKEEVRGQILRSRCRVIVQSEAKPREHQVLAQLPRKQWSSRIALAHWQPQVLAAGSEQGCQTAPSLRGARLVACAHIVGQSQARKWHAHLGCEAREAHHKQLGGHQPSLRLCSPQSNGPVVHGRLPLRH